VALEPLEVTPESAPARVRVQIRALAGIGERARARALAESLLLLHPEEGTVDDLVPAPTAEVAPPAEGDGWSSRSRAEAYVGRGRPDRAIRVLRRLLFHEPSNLELRARLDELLAGPRTRPTDDLSEELPDPSVVPPLLRMPSPVTAPYDPAEDITQSRVDLTMLREQVAAVNDTATAATVPATDDRRRTRRSLLKK
jgi:hypothetical protein